RRDLFTLPLGARDGGPVAAEGLAAPKGGTAVFVAPDLVTSTAPHEPIRSQEDGGIFGAHIDRAVSLPTAGAAGLAVEGGLKTLTGWIVRLHPSAFRLHATQKPLG